MDVFFFLAVTEDEIRNGIFYDKMKNRTLVFHRNVTDLLENLHHSKADKFIDMVPGSGKVDAEAQKLLDKLKHKKIPLEVKAEDTKTFNIKWSNNNGINAKDHVKYLEDLCTVFSNMLKKHVLHSLTKMDDLTKDPRVLEVLQHSSTCETRCQLFQVRTVSLFHHTA